MSKTTTRIVRLLAAAAAALAVTGCRTGYNAVHQQNLADRYYGGDIEGAAMYASGISNAEKDYTDRSALLWHLEAGNTNLDAGNYAESMRCLERAEKLIYLIDGSSPRFHRPGMTNYRGSRSDRLMLHMLKGFNYLADGKVEDFLVEIRRLRAEQFRYVLDEADPELRVYESANFGRTGVPTLGMGAILKNNEKNSIFRASGLNGEYTEYSLRRRPRLPLFYNPLAFYMSALGYAIDNEYEEAVIDFRYLLMLDPQNKLYRQDCAALINALGDRLPDELKNVEKTAIPADLTVCFIVARGCPDGWQDRQIVYLLPGYVPTDWSFSFPVYRPVADPGFSVLVGDAAIAGSHLADLSEIMNDEFWQFVFPRMVERAYRATLEMTVAHRAAEASLVAALAMPNSDYKPLVVASAQLAVAATSRAAVSEKEWRRWVTLPRSYSVAHVQLPPPGSSRKMTLVANGADGGAEKTFELDFSPDTNRAVVYLRDVGNGRYVLKKWESME